MLYKRLQNSMYMQQETIVSSNLMWHLLHLIYNLKCRSSNVHQCITFHCLWYLQCVSCVKTSSRLKYNKDIDTGDWEVEKIHKSEKGECLVAAQVFREVLKKVATVHYFSH